MEFFNPSKILGYATEKVSQYSGIQQGEPAKVPQKKEEKPLTEQSGFTDDVLAFGHGAYKHYTTIPDRSSLGVWTNYLLPNGALKDGAREVMGLHERTDDVFDLSYGAAFAIDTANSAILGITGGTATTAGAGLFLISVIPMTARNLALQAWDGQDLDGSRAVEEVPFYDDAAGLYHFVEGVGSLFMPLTVGAGTVYELGTTDASPGEALENNLGGYYKFLGNRLLGYDANNPVSGDNWAGVTGNVMALGITLAAPKGTGGVVETPPTPKSAPLPLSEIPFRETSRVDSLRSAESPGRPRTTDRAEATGPSIQDSVKEKPEELPVFDIHATQPLPILPEVFKVELNLPKTEPAVFGSKGALVGLRKIFFDTELTFSDKWARATEILDQLQDDSSLQVALDYVEAYTERIGIPTELRIVPDHWYEPFGKTERQNPRLRVAGDNAANRVRDYLSRHVLGRNPLVEWPISFWSDMRILFDQSMLEGDKQARSILQQIEKKNQTVSILENFSDYLGNLEPYQDLVEGWNRRIQKAEEVTELDAVLAEVMAESEANHGRYVANPEDLLSSALEPVLQKLAFKGHPGLIEVFLRRKMDCFQGRLVEIFLFEGRGRVVSQADIQFIARAASEPWNQQILRGLARSSHEGARKFLQDSGGN